MEWLQLSPEKTSSPPTTKTAAAAALVVEKDEETERKKEEEKNARAILFTYSVTLKNDLQNPIYIVYIYTPIHSLNVKSICRTEQLFLLQL